MAHITYDGNGEGDRNGGGEGDAVTVSASPTSDSPHNGETIISDVQGVCFQLSIVSNIIRGCVVGCTKHHPGTQQDAPYSLLLA